MTRVLALLTALLLSAPTLADTGKLEQAINGKHRTEAYVARDKYRHPLATLQLFDVQPHHTVVEVWPGGGWYTEILAPYLRKDGLLIAAHFDPEDTQASYRPRARQAFDDKMASNKRVYSKVKVTALSFDENAGILASPAAEPGSVDRVLTFRSTHNWYNNDTMHAAMSHFYSILKPGGKLGIVQHMADEEQDWKSRSSGYVGRAYVISEATRAGFELHAEGYFNRNPLDNKRYKKGVWQLPPSLRDLETEAEKAPYLAIGESERMTLVFVKPL